jgi:hypothetical protein
MIKSPLVLLLCFLALSLNLLAMTVAVVAALFPRSPQSCCCRQVGLLIIDEIHLLGADRGPVLEVIVSRMRWGGQGRGQEGLRFRVVFGVWLCLLAGWRQGPSAADHCRQDGVRGGAAG